MSEAASPWIGDVCHGLSTGDGGSGHAGYLLNLSSTEYDRWVACLSNHLVLGTWKYGSHVPKKKKALARVRLFQSHMGQERGEENTGLADSASGGSPSAWR